MLINRMEDTSSLRDIHPQTCVEDVVEDLPNTTDFFERTAPEECFWLDVNRPLIQFDQS